MWKCKACGEKVEDKFENCWNCRIGKDGSLYQAGDTDDEEEGWECESCGAAVSFEDAMCSNCGSEITEIADDNEGESDEESELRYCSNCAAPLDEDARFCPSCRVPVAATTVLACPSCERSVAASSKFCKYCAFDLSHASDLPEDGRAFITPAGAGIALICFFLPWVEFSCGGQINRTVSGYNLAQADGIFWIIPSAALVILAAYFFFKSQREIWKAKPLIILSSVIGLAVLIFKYLSFSSGEKVFGYTLRPEDVGLSAQYGGFGTAIGFVAVIVGSTFLKSVPLQIQTPEERWEELDVFRERVSKQSDSDLMRMVNLDFRDYRKEALDLAKAELKRRGASQREESKSK